MRGRVSKGLIGGHGGRFYQMLEAWKAGDIAKVYPRRPSPLAPQGTPASARLKAP